MKISCISVLMKERKKMLDVLRTLFDMSFWREFIDADMREESRMMHDYE